MNRGILGSILFGTQRERDRATVALANLISGLIFAVALFLAALIFLLPGIIINHIRGRYRNDPHNLRSSIQDWQTWIISLPISAIMLIYLNASGAFGSHLPATEHRSTSSVVMVGASPTAASAEPSVAIATSSVSPIQVRRAEAVVASSVVSSPTSPISVRAALPVQLYTVVGAPNLQSLNVRKGPGANYDIVDKLWSDQANIQIIDSPVMNGPTEWVHIRYNTQSGWVNKQFLRPNQVAP